jgi:serine/threonine-protein kinase
MIAPRRLVPFVVAAILVIVVALAVVAFAGAGATSIEVPGVVGRTVDDARALAARAGLDVQIVERRSAPDAKDTVIAQEPDAGAFTRADGLLLVLSSGPAPVEVPGVVGVAVDAAMQTLNGAGFTVERGEDAYDNTNAVPAGSVLTITPGVGEKVAPESKVTIVVSKGHEPVAVPDVVGKSLEDAQAQLTEAGFVVDPPTEEFSDNVEKGAVISSTPAANEQAAYGSNVKLVVSKGQDLVEVPDVIGLTLPAAVAELEAAGLTSEVDGPIRQGRRVVRQDPEADDQIKRGSIVTLTLED